jgi:SAM-dependent methyltransferase
VLGRIRQLLDNRGYFKIMRDFMRAVGGLRGLAAWVAWERYYLALMARAAAECGAICGSPPTDFAYLLQCIAERHGVLDPESCRVKVRRPRARYPTIFKDYFATLEWLLSRACELATRPPREVLPEEEARAAYHAFLSQEWYCAVRRSMYAGAGVPLWGRVLLIGAGTVEPVDYWHACRRLGAECRYAAMEVDERALEDLRRLAARYGFEVLHGWEEAERAGPFDGAIAQNVLHWATDPLDVLMRARRAARRLLLSQIVIEGAGAGFLVAYVLGARRSVSWREVESLARQAGWRLKRRYAKYPNYVAVFE